MGLRGSDHSNFFVSLPARMGRKYRFTFERELRHSHGCGNRIDDRVAGIYQCGDDHGADAGRGGASASYQLRRVFEPHHNGRNRLVDEHQHAPVPVQEIRTVVRNGGRILVWKDFLRNHREYCLEKNMVLW